tara:strand:- start:7486 stop:9057 length:1572 start_codon:yes stop_codon:yes gene_type:complete
MAQLPESFEQARSNITNALDHFANKRVFDAEVCLHKALEQAPNHPDALHLLGLAAKQRGNNDEAIHWIQRALEEIPDQPIFLNNLANILLDGSDIEAAINHYRHAISVDPDYADAHFNLGIAFAQRGQTQDAIASYRQTLALDGDRLAALHNLGGALESLGCVAEALVEYRTAVAKSPSYARAYYRIATLSNTAIDQSELRAMENLLSTVAPNSDDAIHLHFGLARAYANIGRPDDAFRQWEMGNKAKRATYVYDVRDAQHFHERIAKAFSSELLNELEHRGSDSDVPIFVVGMPRSGTTLVEQILASHPKVAAAGELSYLRDISRKLSAPMTDMKFPEIINSLGARDFRTFASEYLGKLCNWAPTMPHIVDKMPGNFLYIGLIKLMFPKSKIIHCVRDPVATCFSCYTQLFNSPQRFAYDLTDLGLYHSSYRHLMRHWHQITPGSIFNLKYEDMVDDQEAETRSLLKFCNLDWDDSCLQFHKTDRAVRTASALQVRQPIYKESLSSWHKYKVHLDPLFAALD